MSTEDDICLWCQDSLAQHGLVIELTTEDFKQMFKHDASCKIIHYACFKDYQKKRAKDSAENEQNRTTEPTERSSSSLDGPLWLRTLFAVLSTEAAEIRLAAPAWPLPVPDLPYICEFQLQIAAPAWPGPELYHSHLCVLPSRRRAVVRPSGPEHYFRNNSASVPRAHLRSQQPYEMQFFHPALPSQPFSQPVVHADRSMPPFYNRFVPYTHPQCYFNGNPTPMIENQIYFQGQSRPSYCIPRHVSPTGTYSSYSVATHSHSVAGYQSVYQERTQCHWSAQPHNRMFA